MSEWLRWHSVWAHVAAPVWRRVPERYRWRIVDRLNKSQRRCWCDLVDAAIADPEDDACDAHIPSIRGARVPRCAVSCDWMHDHTTGDCGCYCGKFGFEEARR